MKISPAGKLARSDPHDIRLRILAWKLRTGNRMFMTWKRRMIFIGRKLSEDSKSPISKMEEWCDFQQPIPMAILWKWVLNDRFSTPGLQVTNHASNLHLSPDSYGGSNSSNPYRFISEKQISSPALLASVRRQKNWNKTPKIPLSQLSYRVPHFSPAVTRGSRFTAKRDDRFF